MIFRHNPLFAIAVMIVFMLITSCAFCIPFADKILVLKEKRELHLLKDGQAFKIYKVVLGGNPVGHKKVEGDQKTPEGNYKIIDLHQRWRY